MHDVHANRTERLRTRAIHRQRAASRARIEILADRFALRTDQIKQMLALSDEFPVIEVEQLYKEALARQWSSRQWQARFDEFIRVETGAK